MSKLHRTIILFVVTTLLVSCTAPTSTPPTSPATTQPDLPALPEVSISRHPQPADFSSYYVELTSIPVYDLNSDDPFQIDLRSRDLTSIDMTNSLSDLMYATFDSKTKWPAPGMMSAAFDPHKILELNKDPGLGVRNLHQQGIDGTGIGIAIIDQTLLVDHIEYKDRIRVYEEAEDIGKDWTATMHGAAVTSIAAGKTVGIAPNADLYYIATENCGDATSMEDLDFSCRAKAIHRIVEINRGLPDNRKIRVLSMSFGWDRKSIGYDEVNAAVNEAKAQGIFVVSSSLGRTHELYFHGLGRKPLDDPDQFMSYTPGLWWEQGYFAGGDYLGKPPTTPLLVPMDSRTTASPTGTEDYVFYREGGWSWSIPYIAGMYALAAQVKPDITPEEFWETALQTGRTTQIIHDGKEYDFGVILDPQALIEAIRSK